MGSRVSVISVAGTLAAMGLRVLKASRLKPLPRLANSILNVLTSLALGLEHAGLTQGADLLGAQAQMAAQHLLGVFAEQRGGVAVFHRSL